MSLVERIRTLCDSKDTTLIGLEREIGLGRGTIRKWDEISPSAEKLQKVAQYFNVSVDYLLNGTVGNVFAERRKELKFTIEDLANLVGVEPEYIKRLENGSIENPPIGLLEQIANTLQLKEDDEVIYIPSKKYGEKERHIDQRGSIIVDGSPVSIILANEAEDNLIARYRKLPSENQKLFLQFLDGLEIMEKAKKEQSAGQEVG